MKRFFFIESIIIFIILLFTCENYAATEIKGRIKINGSSEINIDATVTVEIDESKSGIDFSKNNTIITSWKSSDESILKIESVSSSKYQAGVYRTVYSKTAKVTGKKSGEADVIVMYETEFGTQKITYSSTIKIKVKSKEETKKEIEKQIEELDISDDWKTIPEENADADKIRNFVISDANYNGGKAIKDLAKTEEGIKKIRTWRRIIYTKISQSPTQYGDKLNYGSTRDILDAIIKAYDEKKDASEEERQAAVDTAVDENLPDAQTAAETYQRLVKFRLDDLRESYEERLANAKFDDALEEQSPYTAVDGVDNREATVRDKVGRILGAITNIGIVFSVLMLAAIGIKYILASPEEKADYQKDMVPYLVGVTLLLSVCTVVKIVQVLGENINKI